MRERVIILGPVCTTFSGFGVLEFYSQVGERGLEKTGSVCTTFCGLEF